MRTGPSSTAGWLRGALLPPYHFVGLGSGWAQRSTELLAPSNPDKYQEVHQVNTNLTPTERALHLRMERLDAEREVVSAKLDLIHKFGDDEYENGAVIRFDKVLSGNSYSYVAIKCNGCWYTSGPVRGGTPRTWGDLIGWLADGTPTTEIWLVESYVEVTR